MATPVMCSIVPSTAWTGSSPRRATSPAGRTSIASGQLRYQVLDPLSEMAVLGNAEVLLLRYQVRIGFDHGPGITRWHTHCYQLRDETWLRWGRPRSPRAKRVGS